MGDEPGCRWKGSGEGLACAERGTGCTPGLRFHQRAPQPVEVEGDRGASPGIVLDTLDTVSPMHEEPPEPHALAGVTAWKASGCCQLRRHTQDHTCHGAKGWAPLRKATEER